MRMTMAILPMPLAKLRNRDMSHKIKKPAPPLLFERKKFLTRRHQEPIYYLAGFDVLDKADSAMKLFFHHIKPAAIEAKPVRFCAGK